jgi:hypothetical protein
MEYLATLLKKCDLEFLLQSGYKHQLCSTLVQMIYIEKEEHVTKVPLVSGEPVLGGGFSRDEKDVAATLVTDDNVLSNQSEEAEFREIVTVLRHLRISPGIKMNAVQNCRLNSIFLFIWREDL